MADSARAQIGVDLPDPPEQELPAQEIEEGPSRPEWLPEKFKDEQEFANSYKTLEDELRRRGENQNRLEAQLTQLTEVIEGMQAAPEPLPQQQGMDPNFRQQLMDSYENDPIGTMSYLAQQYADYAIEQKIRSMQEESTPAAQQQLEMQNQMLAITVDRALSDRYEDWGAYKERVAEEIQADNSLLPQDALRSPETTMRALSRVYENVKAREILQGQGNGTNFVTDQMKRQAQTLSGTTGRPGEPSPDDEKFAQIMAAAKGMSYSAWRGAQ